MNMLGMNKDEVRLVSGDIIQVLGPRLTATTCGAKKWTDVRRWEDGTKCPDEDHLERLGVIRQVLDIVLASNDPKNVRAWFIDGSCGEDDSMSPADAIRVCNYDDVLVSARQLTSNA